MHTASPAGLMVSRGLGTRDQGPGSDRVGGGRRQGRARGPHFGGWAEGLHGKLGRMGSAEFWEPGDGHLKRRNTNQ